MKDDPVIRKIREVRHQISAEHDHNPRKLVAYYMERQQQRQGGIKKDIEERVAPKQEA